VAVRYIGGGNQSTRRKPLTCHKSLTNFSHNVVSSTPRHEQACIESFALVQYEGLRMITKQIWKRTYFHFVFFVTFSNSVTRLIGREKPWWI